MMQLWRLPLVRWAVCGLTALIAAGQASAQLFPGPKFTVGDEPRAVVVADLNGDTIPDLVTANYGLFEAVLHGGDPTVTIDDRNGDVTVLLGNGDGTFRAPISFAAGERPVSQAVADLDGDTIPDLVTTNHLPYSPTPRGEVNVLLGNGDGTFRAPVSFKAGSSPQSVAVADLDGDTIPDLVTANPGSHDVSVLRGNGDGTFRAASYFSVGEHPLSVTVADLDGDTFPDLITPNFGSDDVSVLLGNGDGTFQAAAFFAMGLRPSSAVVVDIDGDTLPDLVTANSSTSDVSVLLGNGDGTFEAAASFSAGAGTSSVAVADLDGDAFPDLVTGNRFSDDVSVLLNLTEIVENRAPIVACSLLAVEDHGGDDAEFIVQATATDPEDGDLTPEVELVALAPDGSEAAVFSLLDGDKIRLRVGAGKLKVKHSKDTKKVERSKTKKFQVRARADSFVLRCNVSDSGGLSDARSVTVDSSVTEMIHDAKPDVSEKNIMICGIGFETGVVATAADVAAEAPHPPGGSHQIRPEDL